MLTRGRLWLLWLVGLLTTTLVYAVWLAPLEAILQARGHGIVPLELAWSRARFAGIVAAWGSVGTAAARQQILWDFAWIPAYALTLWASLWLAGQGSAGALSRWVSRMALAVPIAALLDCIENIALLQALRGWLTTVFVVVASACSSVKFILLALAGAVVVWAVVARLKTRLSAR